MKKQKNRLVHYVSWFFRSFTEHPATVNETYFQHFLFAMRLAILLLAAGLAALIHALLPALFAHTASEIVERLHRQFETRHQRPKEPVQSSNSEQGHLVSQTPQYTD